MNNVTSVVGGSMADEELVPKRAIFNAILCFNDANGEIYGLFQS